MDQELMPSEQSPLDEASVPGEPLGDESCDQTMAASDALQDPHWCEPTYPETMWRIGFEFSPTTTRITDGDFGYWTDDPVLASRFVSAYEFPSGKGVQFASWSLAQEVRTWQGVVENDASTFYVDVFQRIRVSDAELRLGGGPAVARLKIDYQSDETNRFTGAGVSVFGEGFYPFLRFKKTDVGVIGHARLAVLGSLDNDVLNDNVALIDDLGWGLELRRRYGRRQDRYWYFDVVREVQHWGGASKPFASDEVFQGISFKFGFAF